MARAAASPPPPDGFTPFEPFFDDGSTAGWYSTPGTLDFQMTESTEHSSYSSTVFGGSIKTVYVSAFKRMGRCTVDGQPFGSPIHEEGGVVRWPIAVPTDVNAARDFIDGKWTVEGIFEVRCTVEMARIESSTWFGFIPGDQDVHRWEAEHTRTISIDSSPPSVVGVPQIVATQDPQGTNWHRTATTLDVIGTDDVSGIARCERSSSSLDIDGPTSNEDRIIQYSCTNGAGMVTDSSYVYRFDDEAPLSNATLPLGRNGWHRDGATVVWGWSDHHSGVRPAMCPAGTAANGEGEAVEVVGTCTDWAGNRALASQTMKVDATAPTITLANRPDPNAAGWYRDDVRLDWSCADELSGPEATRVSRIVADEGSNNAITGICTDVAGNESRNTQSGIKLDKTQPKHAPAVTGELGRDGWFVSPVSVRWRWTDALSGIVEGGCRPESVADEEGAGQVLVAQCHDLADNARTAEWTVDVDLGDPVIVAFADRTPEPSGWYTEPVSIRFTCVDPGQGSGLASSACPVAVTVSDEGVTTITRSVRDLAGRESTVSKTVKVDLADPTIVVSADRAPDVDRWYTARVTMSFACSDPPPGSGIVDCPVPITVVEEGDHTVRGKTHDHAGRDSAEATASVRVDLRPPDATIKRRKGAPDLDRGRLTGSASDAVSGIRDIAIRWTHPLRGVETVLADVTCSDASRRVCTWSADAALQRHRDLVVVAIDRVGRADPTPDPLNA